VALAVKNGQGVAIEALIGRDREHGRGIESAAHQYHRFFFFLRHGTFCTTEDFVSVAALARAGLAG